MSDDFADSPLYDSTATIDDQEVPFGPALEDYVNTVVHMTDALYPLLDQATAADLIFFKSVLGQLSRVIDDFQIAIGQTAEDVLAADGAYDGQSGELAPVEITAADPWEYGRAAAAKIAEAVRGPGTHRLFLTPAYRIDPADLPEEPLAVLLNYFDVEVVESIVVEPGRDPLEQLDFSKPRLRRPAFGRSADLIVAPPVDLVGRADD